MVCHTHRCPPLPTNSRIPHAYNSNSPYLGLPQLFHEGRVQGLQMAGSNRLLQARHKGALLGQEVLHSIMLASSSCKLPWLPTAAAWGGRARGGVGVGVRWTAAGSEMAHCCRGSEVQCWMRQQQLCSSAVPHAHVCEQPTQQQSRATPRGLTATSSGTGIHWGGVSSIRPNPTFRRYPPTPARCPPGCACSQRPGSASFHQTAGQTPRLFCPTGAL